MLIIGSHVGFNKSSQLLGSLEEALRYGSNTFMFYTGAPQNTARYPIDDSLTYLALEKMKENDIDYSKVIVHAPYIVNLANRLDNDKFNFAVNFLIQEVERCDTLGIMNLVLHPSPVSSARTLAAPITLRSAIVMPACFIKSSSLYITSLEPSPFLTSQSAL